MIAALLVTVVSVAALSSSGGKSKAKVGGGPQVGTAGTAFGVVISQGKATITYSQRNNAGIVGGLVPGKELPKPTVSGGYGFGMGGGAILQYVTAVIDKVLGAIAMGDEEPLYPEDWTEPAWQVDEIGAAMANAGEVVDVLAAATIESAYGEKWYACRRFVWGGDGVSATTPLFPEVEDLTHPPAPAKWAGGGSGQIACLYQRRQYSTAGLQTDVVPRPGPEDWELAVGVEPVGDRFRFALYLITPPRLGRHRAKLEWQMRARSR